MFKGAMSFPENRDRLPLRIGFVPLVDCAPLVLAYEKGLFRERGLRVELLREPGWATIRDKIVYGELEAAHALAGLGFAVSWGLGVIRRACVTGFLFNSHGDAITVSRELHEEGVTDAATLAATLRTRGRERPVTFGVPHLFSSHHFLLRHWLRPVGVVPGRDVQIVVLPPSLMPACIESGYIDGYCVGEPFNTEAVLAGSGTVVAESADLSPMHPEKALLATREFAETRPEEHAAMIGALSEAGALCDTEQGREEAAMLLSRAEYLARDSDLIHRSLFAGAGAAPGSVSSEEFHLFSGFEVNRPSSEKASWIVNQLELAGMLDDVDNRSLPSVDAIFRRDLYEAALSANRDGSPSERPNPSEPTKTT